MSRSIKVGEYRSRRDGLIVANEGLGLLSVSKPVGGGLWAKVYKDLGKWVIDVYNDQTAQMRAFVTQYADAEEAAANVIKRAPTGLEWYDLQSVITDETMWRIQVW